MIPGLENAEFERFGQMHRNTFIHAPILLEKDMSLKGHRDLFFAGQISGVEGYIANIASGLFVALNLIRKVKGEKQLEFPITTMIGSLMNYVTNIEVDNFQPMKANFGLLPSLPGKVTPKKARYQAYAQRAIADLEAYILENEI
jgi:methylenetetrahydrofolate--tRNA-(uracil-5-)-methyltransferase